MTSKVTDKVCLTYVPVPHLGFGWVQGCVSILEQFPPDMIAPTIVLPRAFRPIAASVNVQEAVPRFVPYNWSSPIVGPALAYRFKRILNATEPLTSIAYFWSTAPTSLIRYARELGFLTVREMFNTCRGTAKLILGEAYSRLGLCPPGGEITADHVRSECEELQSYDYIMSSNPRIETSLVTMGVDAGKILRSTFGWSPAKLAASVGEKGRTDFRALFIGGDTVRKGVPQLLTAWRKSGVKGELMIVGDIDASLRHRLAPYLEGDDVRLIKFEYDLGRLYKSADVFVFPSLEEGDPQVTYEAAGCGLPVITTPMGSANIIKNGVNGIVVEPYDIDGLAAAISQLARVPELRKRLGQQAAMDAKNYTYEKVGRQRAQLLSDLLGARRRRSAPQPS
jgi:glycosyltransferase involved in cell wall biosynthesis